MNNNLENREEEIANEYVYRTSEPTIFDFASELLGLDIVIDADDTDDSDDTDSKHQTVKRES